MTTDDGRSIGVELYQMNMHNTHPEVIVDKNGIVTTRHKKNVAMEYVRELPKISMSARIQNSSVEEETYFDVAACLIREVLPDAKTFSVVSSPDGVPQLVAINREELDGVDDRELFLMETALSHSGVEDGVYTVSATMSESRVSNAFKSSVARGCYFSDEVRDVRDMYESFLAQQELDSETEYVISRFGNIYSRRALALNDSVSAETLNFLSADDEASVRAVVAEKSNDVDLVNTLARDSHYYVRSSACKRDVVSPDNLRWNYDNYLFGREIVVANPNVPEDVLERASKTDWSHKVLNEVSKKGFVSEKDPYQITSDPVFLKDIEIGNIAAKAAKYVTGSLAGQDIEPAFLSDGEARSIAWRISTRTPEGSSQQFRALNEGREVDLNALAIEAARLMAPTFNQRSYGLKWSMDAYVNSIIGWVRHKQNIDKP